MFWQLFFIVHRYHKRFMFLFHLLTQTFVVNIPRVDTDIRCTQVSQAFMFLFHLLTQTFVVNIPRVDTDIHCTQVSQAVHVSVPLVDTDVRCKHSTC